jgi:hypothetical protein
MNGILLSCCIFFGGATISLCAICFAKMKQIEELEKNRRTLEVTYQDSLSQWEAARRDLRDAKVAITVLCNQRDCYRELCVKLLQCVQNPTDAIFCGSTDEHIKERNLRMQQFLLCFRRLVVIDESAGSAETSGKELQMIVAQTPLRDGNAFAKAMKHLWESNQKALVKIILPFPPGIKSALYHLIGLG